MWSEKHNSQTKSLTLQCVDRCAAPLLLLLPDLEEEAGSAIVPSEMEEDARPATLQRFLAVDQKAQEAMIQELLHASQRHASPAADYVPSCMSGLGMDA